VFAVQIQPTALAALPGSVAASKRSRKRKAEKDANAPPRALSAYNVFMKGEVAKVKTEHPELAHREAFKMAAERWQASPMNPQNGGERFPEVPMKGGEADGAANDGMEDTADEPGVDPALLVEDSNDTKQVGEEQAGGAAKMEGDGGEENENDGMVATAGDGMVAPVGDATGHE